MVCCHTFVGTTDLWLQHVDFATREARTLSLPGYRNPFSSVTVRTSDKVAFFVGEVQPNSKQYQVVVVNFACGAFYTLADDCISPSIMLLPESLEIAYLTKDAKG